MVLAFSVNASSGFAVTKARPALVASGMMFSGMRTEIALPASTNTHVADRQDAPVCGQMSVTLHLDAAVA